MRKENFRPPTIRHNATVTYGPDTRKFGNYRGYQRAIGQGDERFVIQAHENAIIDDQITYEGFDIDKVLAMYPQEVRALKKTGYEDLIPLLDKKVEGQVLEGLQDALVDALQALKPQNEPNGVKQEDLDRRRTEIYDIRALVEQTLVNKGFARFEEQERTKLTDQEVNIDGTPHLWKRRVKSRKMAMRGFVQSIRVIPPEDLFGLCAPEEEKVKLTDIGTMVVELKDRFPDLFMFEYRGGARESLKSKPVRFRRTVLPAESYRLPVLWSMYAQKDQWYRKYAKKGMEFDFPESDFDFVAYSKSGNHSLDHISRIISRRVFKPNKGGWSIVKQSSRRNFSRIEFGIRGAWQRNELDRIKLLKRSSLGHIFPPAYKGSYDFQNLMITFLMQNTRVDFPVLLVPYYNEEENEYVLWGLSIDLFGGFQDLTRARLYYQRWLGEIFSLANYIFPEMAFPQDSPQQLLFNLGYMLRTNAYTGRQPIMRSLIDSSLIEDQLEDPVSLKKLVKETQEFLTEEVIRYIYDLADSDISAFGSSSQRLEAGISFLEDMAQALEGDVISSLLRLLPAGVKFTQDKRLFEIDVYGLGIADKEGILTNLGILLSDKNVQETLRQLVIGETSKIRFPTGKVNFFEEDGKTVENSDEDDKYKSPGRALFFDFLFNLAENNPNRVLELLKPIWCTEKEWLRVKKKYIARLVEIDGRFSRLAEQKHVSPKIRERILTLLRQQEMPMTALELRKEYYDEFGVEYQNIGAVLSSLIEQGQIVGMGKPINKTVAKSGPRVNSDFIWYCSSEVANEFKDDPQFASFENRLLAELGIEDSSGYTELETRTGISTDAVSEAMHRLEQEKLIEYDKGQWRLKRDASN